jgi:hypothetical protein
MMMNAGPGLANQPYFTEDNDDGNENEYFPIPFSYFANIQNPIFWHTYVKAYDPIIQMNEEDFANTEQKRGLQKRGFKHPHGSQNLRN